MVLRYVILETYKVKRITMYLPTKHKIRFFQVAFTIMALTQFRNALEPVLAGELVSPLPDSIVIEKVDVRVEEKIKPIGCNTQKCEIMSYILEVFQDDAMHALNVLECENGNLDPYAVNYNNNGTVDRGIFQLNSAYWGGEENFDWKTNIDKAYEIFERSGKQWTPWTCSHRVGEANYLGN